MPSGLHNKLEKFAEDTLLREGFKHIYREYPIIITLKNNEKKRFVVDVVGIKENKKVAIECITVAHSKLQTLKIAFDEVRHIIVDDYIEYLETKIRDLELKKQATKTVIRTIIKPINITKRIGPPKVHRITKNTELIILITTRFIPYDDLVEVLRSDGEAFLEGPFKRQTIWYAAKKLSKMIGKTVRYDRALLEVEGVATLAGYSFALEEPNET